MRLHAQDGIWQRRCEVLEAVMTCGKTWPDCPDEPDPAILHRKTEGPPHCKYCGHVRVGYDGKGACKSTTGKSVRGDEAEKCSEFDDMRLYPKPPPKVHWGV